MKRFAIICLTLCLVTVAFANTVTRFSSQALSDILANMKADIALGTPITVGETIYLPLFKAEAGFFAGAGGKNKISASGAGGTIELMPFAIAMLSPTQVTVYPISNEKTFVEQIMEALPELIPFVKDLLMAAQEPSQLELGNQPGAEPGPETLWLSEPPVQPDTATYLGIYTLILAFQNEFLETVQDAYSFLLIGDPAIEEEYTQNLHQTEKALIALENTIWSNNALKTQYAIELLNQMKIGLFSVRNAFDTLFKAFKEKGRIPVSDLTSLLKQIEHMNLSFEQIEEAIEEQVTGDPAFLESVAEANPETGSIFVLTYHFAALESDIFQFIENVYRLQLPTETSTLTVTTEGLLEEQEEIESLTAQMQAFFERAQIDEIEALREIFDPMTTLFQTTSELVERGHAISETIMNAEVPAKEDTLAFKTLVDIYTRLIDTITTRLMEQLEAHR